MTRKQHRLSMLLLRHRQKSSGRTVEAGHYVVLAAITSKFIWAPERKNKQKKNGREKNREKRRGEYMLRKKLLQCELIRLGEFTFRN